MAFPHVPLTIYPHHTFAPLTTGGLYKDIATPLHISERHLAVGLSLLAMRMHASQKAPLGGELNLRDALQAYMTNEMGSVFKDGGSVCALSVSAAASSECACRQRLRRHVKQHPRQHS